MGIHRHPSKSRNRLQSRRSSPFPSKDQFSRLPFAYVRAMTANQRERASCARQNQKMPSLPSLQRSGQDLDGPCPVRRSFSEGGSASFVRTLVARLTLPRPPHPAPCVREDSRNAPLSGTGCEKF